MAGMASTRTAVSSWIGTVDEGSVPHRMAFRPPTRSASPALHGNRCEAPCCEAGDTNGQFPSPRRTENQQTASSTLSRYLRAFFDGHLLHFLAVFLAGDRGFESISLQRRVRNEPLSGEPPKSSEPAPRRGRAWTRFPDLGARSHIRVLPPKGDRGFESTSLHRRVHCEPDFLRFRGRLEKMLSSAVGPKSHCRQHITGFADVIISANGLSGSISTPPRMEPMLALLSWTASAQKCCIDSASEICSFRQRALQNSCHDTLAF
jgi:hypothetical protein